MILFFEGKDYKRTLLESVFGRDHAKVISRGNLRDEKALLDCVGYYYDPVRQHVFILPKVFYKNGKGFGFLELKDDAPITDSPDLVQKMKDEGWAENILTDLPVYLYQAIEKYRKREIETIVTEKDTAQNVMSSKKGKTETSLMDVILSLRDFYDENQNLFILTYKQNHSGFNKVNWAKTIRTQQPVIQGQSVIYPYVVNHRKEINYDEELLVLFFSTLKYINSEYHFRFVVDQPYNLISEKEYRQLLEKGKITKRLEAIRDYAEFGAGFQIAMRDMEIRGAGSVLGAEQHGHIDSVGYDLYMKLLEEAVIEEKGEEVKKPLPECAVDVRCGAFLSKSYIASAPQRMDMYKRIARVETDADYDDILDELCDRYGEPNAAAVNLCRIARIRALGRQCGFTKIEERDGAARFYTDSVNPAAVQQLASRYPLLGIRVQLGQFPHISMKVKTNERNTEFLLEILTKYAAFLSVTT